MKQPDFIANSRGKSNHGTVKIRPYRYLGTKRKAYPVWAKPVLLTLAVIGIVYGAIAATMQTDLKRLVAYSSVVNESLIHLFCILHIL
jgi:formate hydrogenlyase subunit 3/multisubunit Na+/H+ antiporter MnhD subunit